MTERENESKNKRKLIVKRDLILLGIISAILILILGIGAKKKLKDISETREADVIVEEETEVVEEKVVDDSESEYVIPDFEVIYQMPELPTGCEITAMSMVLNYWDYPVDKMEMATYYMPQVADSGLYEVEDGTVYGNDMNNYFIGDPTTEWGIACGTGAVVTAVNSFMADCGSSTTAIDGTGMEPEELYELVRQNIPVAVWCTIGNYDRTINGGWYTEYGEYVDWSVWDHGAVLIGYSPTSVTIADPLDGIVEYDRDQFESIYEARGKQCVYITG